MDIVAYNRHNVALFEVKWRDLKLKDVRRILRELERKAELSPLKGTYMFGVIARRMRTRKS